MTENNFSTSLQRDLVDLQYISQTLTWDQFVNLPSMAPADRSSQIACIAKLRQELLVKPETKALVQSLDGGTPKEQAVARVLGRDVHVATSVPDTLTRTMIEVQAKLYSTWVEARQERNFSLVSKLLKENIRLTRDYAHCLSATSAPLDTLIDQADEGFTSADIQKLFSAIKEPLIKMISARQTKSSPSAENATYDIPDQEKFCRLVISKLGYDFERGRMDRTPHPFMIRLGTHDVRLTTRFKEHDLTEGLFSCIHETGHALYELGIDQGLSGTLLEGGVSSGVHESQSRLWENMVGRSQDFWRYWFPKMSQAFPTQLRSFDLDQWMSVVNTVEPGLIRTDADEVTYNLHVMIRFELESLLLGDHLAVEDLPEVWSTRYEDMLGRKPSHVGEGVLQDVHWFCGPVGGAFQGYTIGNLLAAQVYAAAAKNINSLDEQIAKGDYRLLRSFLTEKLYQHGKLLPPNKLIEQATGKPLSAEDFLAYLNKKYRT
jgi:carboxypeptidase Taq